MKCTLAVVLAAGVALAGCGSDDDTDGVDAPALVDSPSGLWRGGTDDGRTIEGLILPDGEFRFVYSARDDAASIGGLVVGTLRVEGTGATATRVLDYNLEGGGVTAAGLDAEFVPRVSFDGALLADDGQTAGFATTYDAIVERTATANAVASAFEGTVSNELGTELASFDVGPDGALTGTTAGGCDFAGSLVPRTDTNAYDASITYAGGPCSGGTRTDTGPVHVDASGTLVAALLDPDRSQATVFVGRGVADGG